MRVGIAINDTSAGLLLSYGIVLALLARERTGEGQWVQTSLLEAQIYILDFQAARYLMKGEVAGQEGNFHPTSPGTGMFETADGFINIAASGDNLWRRFCEAAGARDLLENPDFATVVARAKNRPALIAHLNEIMRRHPNAYWVELLSKVGVPCGPINTIDQTFADPQVQHLGIAKPVNNPKLGPQKMVGQPIHLSAYPQPDELRPTPDQGQHTEAVLADLGYDAGAIADLRTAVWSKLSAKLDPSVLFATQAGSTVRPVLVFASLAGRSKGGRSSWITFASRSGALDNFARLGNRPQRH